MNLPQKPFLYPILDDSFSENLIQDSQDLIRAGIKLFQLRAKRASNFELLKIVQILCPVCANAGAKMIVNDRVDLCMVSDASGVHLGQSDFPAADARMLLPEGIIGVSTHNQMQVECAVELPVDYIAVGPIYPTSTKKDSDPVAGLDLVRHAASKTKKPVVAIGGIRPENFSNIISAGASGIALISALYIGRNLYDTTKELISRLQ